MTAIDGVVTAYDRILDKTIRHAVLVERWKSGLFLRLLDGIEADGFDKVIGETVRHVARLNRLTRTRLKGEAGKLALRNMVRAQRETLREAYRAARKHAASELVKFAVTEAQWIRGAISSSVPIALDLSTPATETLRQLVTQQPTHGKLIREWFSELGDNAANRIAQATRIGIARGDSTDRIVRSLTGTRQNPGVFRADRQALNSTVRTIASDTSAKAREETFQQTEVVDAVQFVATLDNRTTEACAGLDGRVFPKGDGPRPPIHFNCLPGNALVTSRGRISGVSKRWFDGHLIVIRTASGRELSCTPNHPVLTDIGWLPAESVDLSRKMVAHIGSEWEGRGGDLDEDVPATIHEVTEAFLCSGEVSAVPMPVAAEDFHGDGVDGQVAVVASNRQLGRAVDAVPGEHPLQGSLCIGGAEPGHLTGDGHAAPGLLGLGGASDSVVSRGSQSPTLLGRSSAHPRQLLLAPVPTGDSAFAQDSLDGPRGAAEVAGNPSDPDPLSEHGNHFVDGQVDAPWPGRTELEASVGHTAANGVRSDAQLARDILDGCAGRVALDHVVSVETREFSDHVYNLETELGAYGANGLIVHNCRSTVVPVLKSWKAMGIDLEEAPPGTRAQMPGSKGQATEKTTYGEWLKRQDRAIQEDVLGKERARMFRNGEVTIDRFVDYSRTPPRKFTLEELRKREGLD